MKKRRTAKGIPSERRSRINFIRISRPLQRLLSIEDIRNGLALHRGLDSLPCAFRSEKGSGVMVASTADLSQTLLFLPAEHGRETAGLKMREIDAGTVAE